MATKSRHEITRWSLVALVALASPAWADDEGLFDDEEPSAADDATWADANAERGRVLFRAAGAGGQGPRGAGKSAVASSMFPRPRDLTTGEYRFRSTDTGNLPLRVDILRTLERGLPGTQMPAWGDKLEGVELRSLVLYLETLSPRFAKERDMISVLVDRDQIDELPATPARLEHGREVYMRMKCGDCHGELGRGDGESASTLKNNDGTASHVFDFTHGVYKGGYSPFDVYRTFVTGLNGTPMPSYAGSLPDEEDRWALVHYVRSLTRPRGLWFYLSERPTHEEPILRDEAEEKTDEE